MSSIGYILIDMLFAIVIPVFVAVFEFLSSGVKKTSSVQGASGQVDEIIPAEPYVLEIAPSAFLSNSIWGLNYEYGVHLGLFFYICLFLASLISYPLSTSEKVSVKGKVRYIRILALILGISTISRIVWRRL